MLSLIVNIIKVLTLKNRRDKDRARKEVIVRSKDYGPANPDPDSPFHKRH